MPSDDDIALDEKRVYGGRRAETLVSVASPLGLTAVGVSDDQIGRFELARQCEARDVAGADGRLVAATGEDVLLGTGDGFAATGFGPAVAAGAGTPGDDPSNGRDEAIPPLAGAPDGTVARLVGDEWETLGSLPAVRAIDGDLVAAPDRVYRVDDGSLEPVVPDHAQLGEVRDVATAAVGGTSGGPGGSTAASGATDASTAAGPYAATGRGLFRLRGERWLPQVADPATVVACDGERAHAVADGTLLAWTEDGWRPADPPGEGVVGVAYGEGTVAVTDDGTVLVDPVTAKDGTSGWRSRALGLDDVAAVAVP